MQVKNNTVYEAVHIHPDTHEYIAGVVVGARLVTDAEGRPCLKIADSLYEEGLWVILTPSKRAAGKFIVYEVISEEVFRANYSEEY